MGTYCLSALKDSMNNINFNFIALSACLALVLLPFTVDAGYVSKQEKRNCYTEYETVTSYENQCSTSYEKECNTVKDEHCKPKVEEVCNTVDVQECSLSHERVCTHHDDKQCSTNTRNNALLCMRKNARRSMNRSAP